MYVHVQQEACTKMFVTVPPNRWLSVTEYTHIVVCLYSGIIHSNGEHSCHT